MLSTDQTLHQGRYRVTTCFREDANGSVYGAYDTLNKSNVVLRESTSINGKVATAAQRDAAAATFVSSAKVLTKLRHGSLITVHGYFSEVGHQYLVLEPTTGEDLTKYLEPSTPRPAVRQMLKWADQVLDALAYLHKRLPPIVHGHVRPENIWLSSDGSVKLVAIGVDTRSLTSDGQTTCYRPMELIWPALNVETQTHLLESFDEKSRKILIQEPDARSDIYSVGACFYHLLTGEKPVDAVDRCSALRSGIPDPLRSVSELNPEVPIEISRAILKAMHLQREERFFSAAIMAQVLRTVMSVLSDRGSEEIVPEPSDDRTTSAVDALNQQEAIKHMPGTEDSVQARLERERIKAEERRRELEAEQARLEEEQRRIEARRLALEAEKERQLAEQKRLENEAELEHQRAEHERRMEEKRRLEAEAKEEREKAAQRLAELQTEHERRRAEAERLEREAAEQLKRAEEQLAKLKDEQQRNTVELEQAASVIEQQIRHADERLSELGGRVVEDAPLVIVEAEEPAIATAPADAVVAVLETSQVVAQEPVEAAEPTWTFTAADEPRVKRSSRLLWPVVGIVTATVLLFGTVGAFFVLSGTDETPEQPQSELFVPAPEAQPLETNVDVSIPETTQESVVAEPTPNASDLPQPTEIQFSEDRGPAGLRTTTSSDRRKPTAPAVATKPVPSPRTPAARKVTVDDLINDNQ